VIALPNQRGALGVLWIAIIVAFSLAGGGLAFGAECDPFGVQLTTTAAPYQSLKTIRRAERVMQRIPERADIIIVGDSLAAMWPGAVAQAQFETSYIWNLGVIGAVTQSVIWQIENVRASHLRPRRVIVVVGTNNLNFTSLPPCAVAEGVLAVASAAKLAWPSAVVTVMGIPPRGDGFSFRARDRSAANSIIENRLHGQFGFSFFQVDAREITCGVQRSIQASQDQSEKALSACINYRTDLIHFTEHGYRKVFNALKMAPRN